MLELALCSLLPVSGIIIIVLLHIGVGSPPFTSAFGGIQRQRGRYWQEEGIEVGLLWFHVGRSSNKDSGRLPQ